MEFVIAVQSTAILFARIDQVVEFPIAALPLLFNISEISLPG